MFKEEGELTGIKIKPSATCCKRYKLKNGRFQIRSTSLWRKRINKSDHFDRCHNSHIAQRTPILTTADYGSIC